MLHQHPYQCDICFHSFTPFFIMPVLLVTPIITLSSIATSTHVRTTGANIALCRHYLQYYSYIGSATPVSFASFASFYTFQSIRHSSQLFDLINLPSVLIPSTLVHCNGPII